MIGVFCGMHLPYIRQGGPGQTGTKTLRDEARGVRRDEVVVVVVV